jgi:hypothetical protein
MATEDRFKHLFEIAKRRDLDVLVEGRAREAEF